MLQERSFSSAGTMQEALYDFCRIALSEDLETREQVSCLLSGGRTPLPCYQSLAHNPLPWQRIQAALVDERWVPVTDPGSNEGSIRACFAGNAAFLDNFMGMYSPATLAEAEAACNARYAQLPRPASFCLLGLGVDGHVASLFPGARGLEQAMDSQQPCQAVVARRSPVTGPCTERMSLTLHGILDSRRIVLAFSGAEKLQVYRRALACRDPLVLPAAAILQQERVPVHVFHSP